MTNLKDWAKEEDVEYAKNKYTKDGFDYNKAEAGKADALKEMSELLKTLDTELLLSDSSFYEDGVLGWDDILYLPELRTLSCAKGLEWPPRLKAYVINSLEKANVAPYF